MYLSFNDLVYNLFASFNSGRCLYLSYNCCPVVSYQICPLFSAELQKTKQFQIKLLFIAAFPASQNKSLQRHNIADINCTNQGWKQHFYSCMVLSKMFYSKLLVNAVTFKWNLLEFHRTMFNWKYSYLPSKQKFDRACGSGVNCY